jgi:hypothetical protein
MTTTSNAFWLNAFVQMSFMLPIYVVYVVFFIIALVRWRRHPRASLLAVVGIAILGLNSVIQIMVSAMILHLTIQAGGSIQEATGYLTAVRVAITVFYVAGMILILTAVFVSRTQPGRLVRYDDPYAPLPEELTRPQAKPPDDTGFRRGNR